MLMKKLVFLLSTLLVFGTSKSLVLPKDQSDIKVSYRIPTWPGKDDETIGGKVEPIPASNYKGVDIHNPRIAHVIDAKTYDGYSKDIRYFKAVGEVEPNQKEYFEFFIKKYSSVSVGLTTDTTVGTGINLLSETCKVLDSAKYSKLDIPAHITKRVDYGVYYVEIYNDTNSTISYELSTSEMYATPTIETVTIDEEYMSDNIGLVVTNGYIPGGLEANDDYGNLQIDNIVDYSGYDKWGESPYSLKSCGLNYEGMVNTVYIWNEEAIRELIICYKLLQSITADEFNDLFNSNISGKDFNDLAIGESHRAIYGFLTQELFNILIKEAAKGLAESLGIVFKGGLLGSTLSVISLLIFSSKIVTTYLYANFYHALSKLITDLEYHLNYNPNEILVLTQNCSIGKRPYGQGDLAEKYLDIHNERVENMTVPQDVSNSIKTTINGNSFNTYGNIYNVSSISDFSNYIGMTEKDFENIVGGNEEFVM